MCYSAMVQQDVRKMSRLFNARIDKSSYEDLFLRRSQGEKVVINKAMELPFTHDSENEFEKKVGFLIQKFHKDKITEKELELFKQKKRQSESIKKLESKVTKKAENDKRISTSKIEKLKFELKKHDSIKIISEDETSIFPFTYVSMLYLNDREEKIIKPFRYHLRPFGQPESFDRKYFGCYNARRDNLRNPFWKPIFGKRHGLLVIHKFYEHVSNKDYRENFSVPEKMKQKKNLILCFEPESGVDMFVPTIWDINRQKGQRDLFSTALITDEPPVEISETGHERCPVFLKKENIEAWLNPKGKSVSNLQDILGDTETPRYRHSILEQVS